MILAKNKIVNKTDKAIYSYKYFSNTEERYKGCSFHFLCIFLRSYNFCKVESFNKFHEKCKTCFYFLMCIL